MKVTKYPKWINQAQDLMRNIENHKHHGLLLQPYIPTKETPKSTIPGVRFAEVEHPISFQSISQMLSLGLYQTFEDLKQDMRTMFENQRKYFAKNSKLVESINTLEAYALD